ncbi:MAG: hypothetical protein C0594_09970 [Marinilabiliales bacterium]|nr:MAG: hypothetical protein C0594_09970 [Marinilabiliales bacterium]
MNSFMKKAASYILVAVVLAITAIALLGIWEVIPLENVIRKILVSLFVIFVASVVVLFIFAVVIRDSGNKE